MCLIECNLFKVPQISDRKRINHQQTNDSSPMQTFENEEIAIGIVKR